MMEVQIELDSGFCYEINGVQSRIYADEVECQKFYCANLLETDPKLKAKARAGRHTWKTLFKLCGVT